MAEQSLTQWEQTLHMQCLLYSILNIASVVPLSHIISFCFKAASSCRLLQCFMYEQPSWMRYIICHHITPSLPSCWKHVFQDWCGIIDMNRRCISVFFPQWKFLSRISVHVNDKIFVKSLEDSKPPGWTRKPILFRHFLMFLWKTNIYWLKFCR